MQKSKFKISNQNSKFLILNCIFAFCIFNFAFTSGCQSPTLHKETRIIMGTFVEVTSPDKEAADIVFGEIQRIENLLSKYNPQSEVSRLNKFGELKVSPETFYIIKKAQEFYRQTNGAFDITVAPLLELWGFTDKKYNLPNKEDIQKTLKFVGSDKIILQEENNVVKFKTLGMKIDLGAIAKGYALDCAIKKLRENNLKSCLINAGGQIFALGDKFGKPWRIAIRNPRTGDFKGYLELRDKSTATSGDYEQYFIKDNQRYSHIFNPKTGYPADLGIISVTVIAEDGLTADALSTAIFVLGKTAAEELVRKFPQLEVRIIEERDIARATP